MADGGPVVSIAASLTDEGEPVAVVKSENSFHALSGLCPHRGAPLTDGYVVEGLLVCSWHRSAFNVETGALMRGPARCGLRSLELLRGGNTK